MIRTYSKYMIFFFLILTWIVSPLAGALIISIYLMRFQVTQPLRSLIWLLPITFALLNSTLTPALGSDLEAYFSEYRDLADLPIKDLFLFRAYDPLFYLTSWMLGYIVGGEGRVFVFFWTLITYSLLVLSVVKLSERYNLNFKWVVLIVAYTLFFGIGFYLSSQLIRQYVAMSILIYAFVRALLKQHYVYSLFITASLIHISVAIFFPLVIIAKKENFSSNYDLKILGGFLIFAFIFGFFNPIQLLIDTGFLQVPLLKNIFYKLNYYAEELPLLNVITFQLLIFTFVVCSMLYLNIRSELTDESIKVFLLLCYLVGLLLFFRNDYVLFWRYYFFGYGFLTFALVPILASNVNNKNVLLYEVGSTLVLFMAATQFTRELAHSKTFGAEYLNNSVDIFFLPLIQYIRH